MRTVEIKWNKAGLDKLEKQLGSNMDRANRKMEAWAARNPSASEGQIANEARRIYRGAGVQLSNNGRDYARELIRKRDSA